MESNGKPGKIHVSPTTAACLTKSGKGRWLIPREDTINAKGLGEMKTYWVQVPSSLSRHSSMDSSYDYETGSQHGTATVASNSTPGGSYKAGIKYDIGGNDNDNHDPVVDISSKNSKNNMTIHPQGGANDGCSWSPGLEMGHPCDDYTTSLDGDDGNNKYNTNSTGGGSTSSSASAAYDVVTNARLIQQQNHVARKVANKVPPPKSTMEHMLTM